MKGFGPDPPRDQAHRLSLWLRHRAITAEQERQIAGILLEVGADHPEQSAPSRAEGDEGTARGVPIAGYRGGYGSTIRGAKPGDCSRCGRKHPCELHPLLWQPR